MVDKHPRRMCRHLMDPNGEFDEVVGWTKVVIDNETYLTFSDTAGFVLTRGCQRGLSRKVCGVSQLTRQFLRTKMAMNKRGSVSPLFLLFFLTKILSHQLINLSQRYELII